MHEPLDFAVLLRLIDERATAFRAAAAGAPDLRSQVPTCPDWTLLDLVRHLGEVHRFWAAAVAAGPGTAPPAESEGVEAAPGEREALLDWSAESTRQLLDALREAGPDRGCWTWWDTSQSPQVSGAVARHQVQEAAVHAYDAQITVGDPQPLPDEAAVDGVDEFLTTCVATTDAWPHRAATIDFHVTEGRSWRVSLSAEGARVTDLPATGGADVSIRGTSAELVLVLYGRIPIDSLPIDGERRLLDQLKDWQPGEDE